MKKILRIRGKSFGKAHRSLICTPLIESSREGLLEELQSILSKDPDLIEWRVDHFEAIADTQAVLETCQALRTLAGNMPLLFTCRSVREGGAAIPLDEAAVTTLYEAVCASHQVDLVDYEMAHAEALRARVFEAAHANKVAVILSQHHFKETPSREALIARFKQAESAGADIAKIAVMPQSLDDVLTQLAATRAAAQQLGIPIISMSMGALGSLSRIVGGVFGSSMTFAVGRSGSAPGQMAIEDLRPALQLLQRQFK